KPSWESCSCGQGRRARGSTGSIAPWRFPPVTPAPIGNWQSTINRWASSARPSSTAPSAALPTRRRMPPRNRGTGKMIGRVSLHWLRFLRRPRWLLLFLVLLAGSVFAGIHVWAWYHFHAGQAALAQYKNESARAHLKQTLRIWPRSAAAHLLAARAERRAGQWAQAEQHID